MKHPDFANDIDISAKYFAKEFSKKNEEGADYNYLISAIFTEVVTTDHALDGVMTGKEVHIGGKSKKGTILQNSSISYKDIIE